MSSNNLSGCHPIFRSVEGVLDWEFNHGSVVKLEAGVHHFAIIVVEEEHPSANGPAAVDTLNGLGEDEPVPDVGGEVLDERHFNQIFKN